MTAILEDVSSETYDKWGTLNTAASPAKLDKNHTPRAINVWPDEKPGSIVTVEGWRHVGDLPSGNPCRFLYTFTKSDGTSMVLCSDNGTVYKTVDFITFTSIISSLSSAFQLRAATVRDKVWLTNGNDSVRTYDGTTVVVLDGSGGTTPNVPKGKFIEFWDERVWLGDIPSHRSSLRFSSLVDTSGNDIAPDDVSAWSTSNEIACGKDDGDVICGLKVYRGVLFPFKAKFIYRIDGQDEFTYAPTRTSATTGSRIQESIQERDNILEFIGKDGLYEFDGSNAQKVSDIIESVDLTQFSFNNIQQGTAQQKSKLWSAAADFTGGTLTLVSATRVDGSVVIDNYTYSGDLLPASDLTNPWTKATFRTVSESVSGGILTASCTAGTLAGQQTAALQYSRTESGLSNTNGTRAGIYAKVTSASVNSGIYLLIDDGTRYFKLCIQPGTIKIIDISATQGAPDATYAMNTTSAYHLYELKIVGTAITVYVDGSSVITYTATNGSLATKKIEFGVEANGSGAIGSGLIDYVSIIFVTTGTCQALSDVYHITDSISSWGAFQATYDTNGGTVTFYMRSGTSSVNCLAASWTAISPGASISFSTSNVYVQWRADFTASGTTSPQLDDVTVNWNTGSAGALTTQGVASIVFNQRYYLAGALTGSSYNNTVIVRGKRVYGGPFIRLSQFNILAFCLYNDQLYAAASDSDDLIQLDQNSNANGSALDSSWETRDEVGGEDEEYNKRFPVIMIHGQKKGNYSLTVDVSIDGGTSFPSAYQKTISLAGTGRFKSELRYPTLRGEKVRVRVRTNGIDQPFDIEKIKIFWRRTLLR
jgi:hypothetical protein